MKYESLIRRAAGTVVCTALFILLYLYCRFPSPAEGVKIVCSYAVSSFCSVVYGPAAGLTAAFAGQMLAEYILYTAPWWSWTAAAGIGALVTGLLSQKIAKSVRKGIFDRKQIVRYFIFATAGNAAAWLLSAPVLDILLYRKPVQIAFEQGLFSFLFNTAVSCLGGVILLKIYAVICLRRQKKDAPESIAAE